MNLPIRLADIPADAPRWTDKSGAVWAEVADDHLVIVEHNGQPVPFADAIPRATVTRQNGQLTAVGVPVADQPETPEDVVQDVADAIGEEFRAVGAPFRDDWTAEARAAIEAYRQHLAAGRDEETARLHLYSAEHAIRANRAEESEQRRIRERDSERMSADRAHGEMYRVRDALGVGPGGADLGLQVRDALAERDAEITRLRARDAAWQVYVAELADTITTIGPLAWTGLDKGADVLQDIYDHATVPDLPAVLCETVTTTTEETQA